MTRRSRPASTRARAPVRADEESSTVDVADPTLGIGRAVTAGGMVYVSSIGPVDPTTGQLVRGGIKEQARQCMKNLATVLENAGSSLDQVVWANWALRDATEFEDFNEVWSKAFPAVAPVGQGTLMPSLQRRAGFRISIGVIAEAGDASWSADASVGSTPRRLDT